MPNFTTVTNTILSGAPFSNYGSTPPIITDQEKPKNRHAKLLHIHLTPLRGPVVQTFDGTIISEDLRGTIEIFARNKTDRDNLQLDVEAGLKSGSYSFSIDSKWASDAQNQHQGFYEVTIKDP